MRPENENVQLLADAVQSLNYDPPAPGDLFAVEGARLDLATGTLTTAGFRSDDTGVTARSFTLDTDLAGAPSVALDDDTLILPGGDYFATSLSGSSVNGAAYVGWLTDQITDEVDTLLLRGGNPSESMSTLLLGPGGSFLTVEDPTVIDPPRTNLNMLVGTDIGTAELSATTADDGTASVTLAAAPFAVEAALAVVSDDFADASNVQVTVADGITLRTTGDIAVVLDGDPAGELFGTWLGEVHKTGGNYTVTTSWAYVGSCELTIPAMGRNGTAVVNWTAWVGIATSTSILTTVYYSIGAGAFVTSGRNTITDGHTATASRSVHIPTTAGQATRVRLYALRFGAGSATINATDSSISVVHYC